MILSKKRIIKALIRLRGCAGWSAPVLFANPRRQVFSRRGPYNICTLHVCWLRNEIKSRIVGHLLQLKHKISAVVILVLCIEKIVISLGEHVVRRQSKRIHIFTIVYTEVAIGYILVVFNFYKKKYLLKKIYNDVIEDIFDTSNGRIFKEIEKQKHGTYLSVDERCLIGLH